MPKTTKYEQVVIDKFDTIRLWAERGFTDAGIALGLGIAESTLNEYKKRHPEFRDFLKMTKLKADSPVLGSLYKRAIGFDYVETTIEETQTEKGTISKRRRVRKTIAPDTIAIVYWLSHRRSSEVNPNTMITMSEEEIIQG